jgi:hypothetical protein
VLVELVRDDAAVSHREKVRARTFADESVRDQDRFVGSRALRLFLRHRVAEQVHRLHVTEMPPPVDRRDHPHPELFLRRIGKAEAA